MHGTFIDLDELIVRCRNKAAKNFIQEAVSCYRVGAYRSCIVATWNAIVFDFLHKLRELEPSGDKRATELLKEFEKLIILNNKSPKTDDDDKLPKTDDDDDKLPKIDDDDDKLPKIDDDDKLPKTDDDDDKLPKTDDDKNNDENKFRQLWKYEASIPKYAEEDLKLILPVERVDIERIFKDRSRCAHPSMISIDEPFEATAELARYHLRSAVTHLLERPPVQGKQAFNRFFEQIESELFPRDLESAVHYFKEGLLARVRPSLLKSIVISLTKNLLEIAENTPVLSDDKRKKWFMVLNAVSQIHFEETTKILNENLPKYIIDQVPDKKWDKVIIYLETIKSWDTLNEQCKIKAENYINKLNVFETKANRISSNSLEEINILLKAINIPFLKDTAIKKLCSSIKELSIKDILSLKHIYKDIVFEEKILIPVLKEVSSEANLKDLSLIMNYSLLNSDKKFQERAKNTIEASSIEALFYVIEYLDVIEYYENEFFISLVESELNNKDKIDNTNLEDLLKAKSIYKRINEPKPNILNLLEKYINERIKNIDFKELIGQTQYFPELSNEVFNARLKENVSEIVNAFINSGNYNIAQAYTMLLVKVAEDLSQEQWEQILNEFFKNNQLYNSILCVRELESLFKKSLEINNQVQPYWLTFYKKLQESKNHNFSDLKRLINGETLKHSSRYDEF